MRSDALSVSEEFVVLVVADVADVADRVTTLLGNVATDHGTFNLHTAPGGRTRAEIQLQNAPASKPRPVQTADATVRSELRRNGAARDIYQVQHVQVVGPAWQEDQVGRSMVSRYLCIDGVDPAG